MQAFQCGANAGSGQRAAPEHGGTFHNEEGPEALAAVQNAVAHGVGCQLQGAGPVASVKVPHQHGGQHSVLAAIDQSDQVVAASALELIVGGAVGECVSPRCASQALDGYAREQPVLDLAR